MKENIEILEHVKGYMQEKIDSGSHKFIYNEQGFDEKCIDVINAINSILFDYRRLQEEFKQVDHKCKRLEKENEELNKIKSLIEILKTNTMEDEKYIVISKGSFFDGSYKFLLNDYISKQEIQDIIERIDYDIKKTKEIISNNKKNNYQIVRLRAMNTKSLDIKNRLQDLLESEEE